MDVACGQTQHAPSHLMEAGWIGGPLAWWPAAGKRQWEIPFKHENRCVLFLIFIFYCKGGQTVAPAAHRAVMLRTWLHVAWGNLL